ncbi:MAG: IS630 family transposase [Planctomycetota bacterium]
MAGRLNFAIARRFVPAGSLVFLDESGAQSNLTRLYGRSPLGQRCLDHTPRSHWKTTTLLSAIRLDGVIEPATVIVDGPMNTATFEAYAQRCLAPALRPGDVVVMGNLSSHKSRATREAIEQAGAELWFLPPYSPDLNPIEKLWSKVKSWLRRVAARSFEAIGDALADVLRTVTPSECGNYFRSCGYGQK